VSKEITIRHPTENYEPFNDMSWVNGKYSYEKFKTFSQEKHITPKTHPLVCDLCSGNGGMVALINNLGWKEKNIACIDKHKPEKGSELALGAKWLFWDLNRLAENIINNSPLSKTVLEQKGKFDLVILAYGGIKPKLQAPLTSFFAKDDQNVFIIPWDFRKEYPKKS
jgi:hypothetical protein